MTPRKPQAILARPDLTGTYGQQPGAISELLQSSPGPLLQLFKWLEEHSRSTPDNGSGCLLCGWLLLPPKQSGDGVSGCF